MAIRPDSIAQTTGSTYSAKADRVRRMHIAVRPNCISNWLNLLGASGQSKEGAHRQAKESTHEGMLTLLGASDQMKERAHGH